MKRVVITGIGAVTPVGMDAPSTWESICAGRHGITKIDRFDTEDLGVSVAALVKDFDPSSILDRKEQRRTDPYCQFALYAATEALRDCGSDLKDLDPYRVGVIIGSGIGGMQTFEENHQKFLEKGPGRVSVFFIPMMISNMAAGLRLLRPRRRRSLPAHQKRLPGRLRGRRRGSHRHQVRHGGLQQYGSPLPLY